MADRVTIVVPDNTVVINGFSKPVDCSALAAVRKHAVQWNGDSGTGHVEYEHPVDVSDEFIPNEQITSIDEYQTFIDAWYAIQPPTSDPLVYRDANARIDAGIAASGLDAETPALLKGKPPDTGPPGGWPPGQSQATVDSLNFVMAEMTELYDQLKAMLDSYTAMLTAQKTPPP